MTTDMPVLTQFKQKGQFVIQTVWIAYSVTVMCYSNYANGFQFESHFADFAFVFFFTFFQA